MAASNFLKEKETYYQIDRFTPIELLNMQQNLFDYAKAINGLPKSHEEVFTKRGWMLPFLFAYDDLLWKRWSYWFNILQKGTIEGSGPIPQIKWADGSGVEFTRKMILKCLDHYDSTIDKFADWLIWALAMDRNAKIDHISPELNKHYYELFDLFLILNYPYDYMSYALSEETGKGYKDGLGYFPTPFQVSIAMTEIMMSDKDPEELKRQSVNDPSVGCGSLLLPASNYTLKGSGQDISGIAVKLCKIQLQWYAPWYAFHPENLKGFEHYPNKMIQLSHEKKAMEGQLMFSL